MAWVTFFSDLLDWPQHLVLVFPFSLRVFFFQGFLKLGPLGSLLNFPTFASCPSYSDFSRSGRSHDFDPCPLFLLSFLEILCIPMASNGIPMWTFPNPLPLQLQIGISKRRWFVYLVVSSVPQLPSSIILCPTSIPNASSCLLIFVNNILPIHPYWKTWNFDNSFFFFFPLYTSNPAWEFPSIIRLFLYILAN